MRRPALKTRSARHGFTIVELLVTLAIVGLLIGLTFPVMNKLTEYSRGSAGANAVSVAVNAARIYNHRMAESDKGSAGDPFPPGADYSGTAALFTPAGEIRLVINDQAAATSGGSFPTNTLEAQGFNGYKDIDGIDYVTLPRTAGIVGVIRTGDTGVPADDLELIPPPFAIRFNKHGQVIVPPTPMTDADYLYYDGDYDSPAAYETGKDRGSPHGTSPYNPQDWTAANAIASGNVGPEGRYELPFEKIEVVSGVILFDAGQLTLTQDTYTATADVQWFLDNGTPLYFSRLSGLVLTNE